MGARGRSNSFTLRQLDIFVSAAQTGSFADFSAHAGHFPVELVTPWVEERDGRAHLCIPDHLGYPVTSEPFDRIRRG